MSQRTAHLSHVVGHAPTKSYGQTALLAAVVAASCLLVAYLVLFRDGGVRPATAAIQSAHSLADIPFNGQRAFEYLEQICEIGPRVSGSAGMRAQQKLLTDHFEKLGAKVERQEFRVRHPQTGEAVPMTNLIVRWHPERRERILLCAHYDTRPFPDRDPKNPRGTFIGASDGASGTALLMELAHRMSDLPGRLGVDFVLFDGEELVLKDGDPYFLGSEYFATDYARGRRNFNYRYGVLVDMVGDADLQIFPDQPSMTWADTRPLVQQIWGVARRLGVREFAFGRVYNVTDDHVKLHDIAGITCCDIIDFDYRYWHTEGDVPANCSALSLAKVGWVVEQWLKQAVRR